MRARLGLFVGLSIATSLGLGMHAAASRSQAKLERVEFDPGSVIEGRAVGHHRPPQTAGHVGNHGSTVIVDAHGLLVAERSAGALIRADREGRRVAALELSPGLGELVHDGSGKVFLADRSSDRIVRVDPGDASGAGLAIAGELAIREPHGLALTPDGATLLVTSVAEHELVAVDTQSLAVRWRVALSPEPRGVAVSADGRHAAVGFVSSSSIALVELASEGRRVTWRSLDPSDHIVIDQVRAFRDGKYGKYGYWDDSPPRMRDVVLLKEARSRFRVPVETGRRYARNAFALAFIGGDTLAVAHQLATPQLERVPRSDRSDVYGGGIEEARPISYRVGLVRGLDQLDPPASFASVDLRQPRALAYDLARDVLYVGGYGDDFVVALADASGELPYVDWRVSVGAQCGIDGLALEQSSEGKSMLWVHCEFGRQLRALELGSQQVSEAWWQIGEELAASSRPEQIERGAELFRRADVRISAEATLQCSSCHPEGRSDGLTWRLGDSILQAPVLAGRVHGTGPYKWDGQDPTLAASLRHTIERLGGRPEELRDDEIDAIVAYIESLPAPKPRTPSDPEAVKRGRAVFEAQACDGCHAGEQLVDREQHELDTSLAHVDTPSLLALGHSAPYYHDGSAIDLWTLVTDRGMIHEMADLSKLTDDQLRDLVAYLESL